MHSHSSAANDRRLLDAPDDYEEAQERLADLNAQLGLAALHGWRVTFWWTLADIHRLREQMNGGTDETSG